MVDSDAHAQLVAVSGQAATQTTHIFGLIAVIGVLGGALIALGGDPQASTAVIAVAVAAGVTASAFGGVALRLALPMAPWPRSPEGLGEYLARATRRVEVRRGLLNDATLALYIMGLATLVAGITAV